MSGGIQDLWRNRAGEPTKRDGIGARYRVRWNGKTQSFRTYKAAQDHWRAVTDPDHVEPTGITVKELLAVWLDGKRGLSKRGLEACEDAAGVVGARWDQTVAATITRPDIQSWIAGLTTPKKINGKLREVASSASHRHKALQALRGALQVAVDRGEMSVNPVEGVTVPPEIPRDQIILSAAELSELADKAGHYRPLILLLGTTGIRIGEACGLDVGDVVAERRRIRVRASSAKSRRFREVPVPQMVLDLLDLDRPATEPLVVTERGKRVSYHNWRTRVWAPIRPTGMVVHDLRHTAASLAIASGADVKAVQRMLGHKSAAMTLDRYSHLFDSGLDDVSERMGQMFG